MECLEAAGFPPRDVNQIALTNELELNMMSVKSLANIKKYTIIELPHLEAEDFQAAMAKAEACRDGGPAVADPSSLTLVPQHCTAFVQWFDTYAADATRQLIPMVNSIQRVIVDLLNEIQANLENIAADLTRMTSATAWEQLFAKAAQAAAELDCDDPTTCYDGLLADAWSELHGQAQGLTGRHAALDLNAKVMATVRRYVTQTQTAFCDGTRKSKDASYRQLSIYRAFWTVLNSAEFPLSKLIEHPKILSDILVQMSGVTFIHNLEVPAGIIRDAVSGMHDEVRVAISEFQGRYSDALNELADDNYNMLAALNGKPPRYCSDANNQHYAPAACDVDKCDPEVSPVAPPACAAGSRCIVDACNGCQAVCSPMSVASSSAGSAVEIGQAWMNAIRSSEGLSKTGDGVKGQLDKLMSSLTYLFSEGTGQGDRVYVFKSGLLTYNEEGRARGKFPCFQGTTRKCFKYKKWTKCANVPRVGSCDVRRRWAMPNEHVPWVAVHSGLTDAIFNGLDMLDSYYNGPSPVAKCT